MPTLKPLTPAVLAQLRAAQINPAPLRALLGDVERRMFAATELRVAGDGKKIEGHAAVFNTKADIWGFQERVAPGAFLKTIKESDVRALFNHDPNFVLGRNKAGTLELSEDATGLVDSITPPDTAWARDLMESIRRGDITQQSFGFRTIKDAWNTEDGVSVRTLLEVQLFDVSPVTFPAYEETDCGVRGALRAADGGEKLYRAVLKLNGGHALDDEELTLVREHVSGVEARLAPGAPAKAADKKETKEEPGHSTANHSSNDVLRRRLDLAENGL